MSKTLRQAIEERRSYYAISDEEIVSKEKVEEVVQFAVKYSPYAFNSQSGRVVILFNEHHKALWDLTKEHLRPLVKEEDFHKTEARVDGFKAGYGTVLFFEDTEVVKNLGEQMPLYEDKFPTWSEQASGILQYVVWTTLETEGLGASLQHYNPLIDDDVKERFDLPKHWRLCAQMPFGKPVEAPGEKTFQSLDERIKVFK
ncbi:hypothetical protein DES38_103132 [Streptohalobacillus salinus]|uniref:Nitroreductase domain-containing protein n=1 Tax=Streptohalobacillus salinus TaxID=621096 RepID=A0A2V3WFQ3_9BACI|nr:nitroreductase family protein [Streptohalobacillus salinus]PXW92116.1 hypothetical protein DES38_103132 [Streptohalobacillus salinus]